MCYNKKKSKKLINKKNQKMPKSTENNVQANVSLLHVTHARGFTLIELLVVIAIIGVMAALVIVNLSTANKKSRDARRKADLSEVRTAMELYYDSYLSYPLAPATATNIAALSSYLSPQYIQKLPVDPKNTGSNIYLYTMPAVSPSSAGYQLNVSLENAATPYTVYGTN